MRQDILPVCTPTAEKFRHDLLNLNEHLTGEPLALFTYTNLSAEPIKLQQISGSELNADSHTVCEDLRGRELTLYRTRVCTAGV